MNTFYVFALASVAARPFQHHGHRIEFIDVGGLYAVVERVDERPSVSEAALRAQHDIVMRIAERVDAVLPARFGAVLDQDELEHLVTLRKSTIHEALGLVAGRVQMTLRTFGGEGGIARPRDVTAAKKRPVSSGTAYLQQRRDASAPGAATGPALEAAAAVREFVVSERLHCGQGRVQWAMYHLIDRRAIEGYKTAVAPFESAALAVSGPWPPFAFAPDLWP
jgi:hypothetical protein